MLRFLRSLFVAPEEELTELEKWEQEILEFEQVIRGKLGEAEYAVYITRCQAREEEGRCYDC